MALARTWKTGDTIELSLPMPVRRVVANDHVTADRGRVALQRGPIVYAAEWADNPDGKVRNLVLPDSAVLTAEFRPGLLKGVEVIQGKAIALDKDQQGATTKKEQPFTAIPYYAWANRGRGEMIVWLPTSEANAKPAAFPTMIDLAKITVSPDPQNGAASALTLQDGEEPARRAPTARTSTGGRAATRPSGCNIPSTRPTRFRTATSTGSTTAPAAAAARAGLVEAALSGRRRLEARGKSRPL